MNETCTIETDNYLLVKNLSELVSGLTQIGIPDGEYVRLMDPDTKQMYIVRFLGKMEEGRD